MKLALGLAALGRTVYRGLVAPLPFADGTLGGIAAALAGVDAD